LCPFENGRSLQSMLPPIPLCSATSASRSDINFKYNIPPPRNAVARREWLYYDISALAGAVTLGTATTHCGSSRDPRGVFDVFFRTRHARHRRRCLLVRNRVLFAGEDQRVSRIRDRGFQNCKLGFVCISRNIESFRPGCFSNGHVDCIAFESNDHPKIVASECFSFVRSLTFVSVPTICN
jgi:hypothetical protein